MRFCDRCRSVVPQGDDRCPSCGEPWRTQVISYEAFEAARAARGPTPPVTPSANDERSSSPKMSPGYPAYVLFGGGVRAYLTREGPWSRRYKHPEKDEYKIVSRFQDGSASLTLEQLKEGWPRWDESSRRELTGNMSWLHTHADYPDMLRFILEVGDTIECMHISSMIASALPQDEAYDRLQAAMLQAPLDLSANFIQAIAKTGHASARSTIEAQLDRLLLAPELDDEDPLHNRCGVCAVLCIHHLFALGAPPPDYEEKIRRLASHRASEVRTECRRYLRGHFEWLDNDP